MSSSVAPSSSGKKDVFLKRLGFTPSLKKKQDDVEMAEESSAKMKSGSSMRASSSGKTKVKLEPLQKAKSGAKSNKASRGRTGGGLVADDAETNEYMNPGASDNYTSINLPSSTDDDFAPSTRSSHIDIISSNGANGDDIDETAGFMNPSKQNLPVVQEGAVGLIFDNTGEQLGVVTEV